MTKIKLPSDPGAAHQVNPYAPPAQDGWQAPPAGGTDAYRHGFYLVIQPGAALPDVCFKCATDRGVRPRNRRFWSVPAWPSLLGWLTHVWPLSALLGIRAVWLRLPLCSRCHWRWRVGYLAQAFLVVAPALFLGGLLVTPLGMLAILGFVLGGVLMLPVAAGGRWDIRARRIEDDHVTLSGVHPAAANATVLLARPKVHRDGGSA